MLAKERQIEVTEILVFDLYVKGYSLGIILNIAGSYISSLVAIAKSLAVEADQSDIWIFMTTNDYFRLRS